MEELRNIYTGSRKQAIHDGKLIEVSTLLGGKTGIKYPICVTKNVWKYIVPAEEIQSLGQTLEGRLWDVLSLFIFYAKTKKIQKNIVNFKVSFTMIDNKQKIAQEDIALIGFCGPGDNLEPVITIMTQAESKKTEKKIFAKFEIKSKS